MGKKVMFQTTNQLCGILQVLNGFDQSPHMLHPVPWYSMFLFNSNTIQQMISILHPCEKNETWEGSMGTVHRTFYPKFKMLHLHNGALMCITHMYIYI